MEELRKSVALPEKFAVFQKILTTSKHKSSAKILCLSTETLRLVYESIRHPADQISFALSCKMFARIAKTTKLNRAVIVSPQKVPIRAYNVDDLKQELRCWQSLRPCKSCKDELPKNRIWKTKDGLEITKLKRVDWLWAVKDWMGGGPICPPCRISEHYDETRPGWLQCRPEGFARVTMFHHEEEMPVNKLLHSAQLSM